MKRRLVGVAAVALLAALATPAATTAHGARAAGDPGRFLVRMIEDKSAGRYAEAWRSLYPLHQQLVPRYEYVACERRMPFPGRLVAVRILRVASGPVSVAGISRPVAGTAVTVRAVVRTPMLRDPVVVVHTFHAVPANGRWTWILSPSRFQLYRGGGCGIHVSV